jgi:hypothetical protein
MATKAVIGTVIAKILSVTVREPSASQTATQTSTLQRTPRKNASPDRQRALGSGDIERARSDGAVAEHVFSGQEDNSGGRQSADEIAEPDNSPDPREFAKPQPPRRPGHHHEAIAGEQLRPADDDQDEPQRKGCATQQSRGAIGKVSFRPGHRHGREQAAQGDEGAAKDSQDEESGDIVMRLPDSEIFRRMGDRIG